MEILAKILHGDAVLPTYAHEGDAGADLVSVETCTLFAGGGRALVGTGLSIAIPEGYAGFVLSRSGLASELRVALVNLDRDHDYVIHPGDRIAQLVIAPVASVRFESVDELPPAKRGDGGFGSSGR
jgi:dUTP pyrophosphatase